MTATIIPTDAVDDLGAPDADQPETTEGGGGTPSGPADTPSSEAPLRPIPVGAAAILATAGAGVLVGNLFREPVLAAAIAIVGALIGAGTLIESRRTDRSWLAWLPMPIALFAAAVVMAPAAGGGTANVPGLVRDALEAGGLEQAPVPFEAGWRGIVLVLHALVASAAASVAFTTRRTRLAVVVPMPLLVGAALLQADGSEVVPTIIAGGLGIAALAAAYGADLAESGATDRGFERQRLLRGGALLAGVLVLGALVAQTGFLFPDTDRSEVVPPQRPPTPPPEPDRVVFRVTGDDTRGPWRLGVLDEYDGEALLLPSIDPDRVVVVTDGQLRPAPADGETRTATVELTDLRGRVLPLEADTLAVDTSNELEVDPRTGVVQNAAGRPSSGFTYTVTVGPRPGGRTLAEATLSSDPEIVRFAEIPDPPPAVIELLRDAPPTPFDRLQFIRQQFYNRVVAAGVGAPSDVPVARAAALLDDGAEATPYEITVMEVLLARWAGIPARMGFGYFRGELTDAGTEFRPRHGAAWLEVHFADLGWVPIVGTPPRAKESLNDELQNDDQQVSPTDELAMVVFVPAELDSFTPLYQTIRYWLVGAAPFLLLVAIGLAAQPVLRKVQRSWRRTRWAAATGPDAQVLVVYAEFRDRMFDLNIGDPSATPKEFLDAVMSDDEHAELAALVTRTLWGDLRGAVGPDDVAAAQDMAASVTRRIRSEQSGVNRFVGAISLASVRSPYSTEIPNVGSDALALERLRDALARVTVPLPAQLARFAPIARRAAAGAVVVIVFVAAAALADTTTRVRGFGGATAAVAFPEPPPARLGRYVVEREPAAESAFAEQDDKALVDDGRVYTLRDGSLVDGSVQIGLFRPDIDARERSIQAEVEASLGRGRFDTVRFGTVRLRRQALAEQTLWLWFPPEQNVMVLFVFRSDVDDDERIVTTYVRHHLGLGSEPSRNADNPADPGSTEGAS